MKTRYSQAIHAISERTRHNEQSQTVHSLNLKSLQVKLANAVEGLESVRDNKSPLITEAAHMKKVHESATKVKQLIERVQSESNNVVMNAYKTFPDLLNNATGLKKGEFDREVREYVRGLKDTDKTKFINESVRERRGDALSAIFDAPHFLTGIQPDIVNKMRESYWEKHAPDLYGEYQDFLNACDNTTTCVNTGHRAVSQITEQVDISTINKQAQAADRAAENFASVANISPN